MNILRPKVSDDPDAYNAIGSYNEVADFLMNHVALEETIMYDTSTGRDSCIYTYLY